MKKILLLFAISALFQLTVYSANTNLAFSSNTRYASAANNAALNVTAGNSVTITLWVKIASGTTSKYFVCKRLNGAGDGYELYQSGAYFAVNISSAGTSIAPAAGSTYPINDGNWHHLAYVLDATNNTSSIYVDSKLEKTLAITHAQAIAGITNTDKLYFGVHPLSTKAGSMTSPMDEVRIYNMAMTPADLLTDMATTVTSATTNLTAAWNFNEGSGTTLADIKTTNPATITGTPTWATATVAASPAIVMAATLSKSPSDADFSPASATPTAISYSSSNPAVATVVNGNIHIVSPGTLYSTSTITASQPASLYYNAGSATSALTISTYCVIASAAGTDGGRGLLNGTVSVNGTQKYTLAPYVSPNWKYTDETASKFTANRGQTITLNVNGASNTVWGDAYAYFDWNGDGIFNTTDERYLIYTYNGLTPAIGNLTVTVPATAVLGDIGMRIKADEGSAGNTYHPENPCSNMNNGTVHTIRFTVAAAVVTPAALTFPNAITSYASAADNAALNVTAGHSVTITAWVKTTSATNQMFVCKRVNGAGDGYELYQSGAYFAVNASSSGTDISPAVGTLYPINDGNWHHVAYVLNVAGTASSIYVDGKLEKTVAITAGQAGAGITNTDALYFGVRNTTTKTLPLNGSLDEVRIYDKAMTSGDLLTDMATTAAVGTTNLTAAWDFNEGSGTTLADVKSTNPATITGSVTWPLITAVAPPAITMGAGLGKLASDADFSPASAVPTAISYSSSNTAVATVVNGKIHIVGVGASVITASQAANLMYTAGTNVTTVLNIYNSSYCVIASSVNTDLGYGLKNGTVSVGGVTKYTLPTNVGGQWQYVEGASQFTVNRGTTITLTVNGNSNTAYGDGYAYFDWNNDGIFNTSDERNTIYTNNGGIVTNKSITITVPQTAVLGDIAMRIKADEAPSFNGYTPGDPCSNMKNGTCNTIKFTIAATPQTITFGAITAKTYGDADFTLAATASSSLPVSYVSSDPTVATVDAASGLVHILKAGTTTITASQAGDATYAAATPAGQLLTVNKAASSITATGTTTYTYNASPQGPGTSTVTGSTGAVSYSYVGVNGTIYTASATKPTAAGSYTVTASVAADAFYAAASSTALGFSIEKAASSITATGTTEYTYNASPQGPGTSTVTGSTGAVSYSYASVDGTTYPASATKPTLVGSYTVTASIAADANYTAASSAALAFSIDKAASSITATGTTTYTYNASPQGPGTSTVTGSTGAVSYSYASVDGTTYPASATKPTLVGSYTVTASVAADANYNAANSSALGFSIEKAAQTIMFDAINSKTYGDADFTLAATASSTLAVSYGSSDPTVATVNASTGLVQILKVGTTTITASQAGNTNFSAAISVDQLLTITPASSSISSNTNLSACGLSDAQLANTNLTISSGEFAIDATKTVQSLTIAPGAKLTLVNGNALTTGALTLQSDASGTATYVDKNTGSSLPAITATVNQYLAAAHSWYVSPAVASSDQTGMTNYTTYDEVNNNWPVVTSTTMTVGKGYMINPGAATNISFNGTLNNGSVPVNLTYTTTNTQSAGFNLVGNPYPSYIDWTAVYAANSAANMPTATMWYRTKVSGAWGFATVNGLGGVASPATVSKLIPPMQAFWVKTSAGGGTLTFDNTMRSHGDGTSNLMKTSAMKNTEQQLVRLTLSDGTNSDETVVYTNAAASDGFDAFDSQKMTSTTSNTVEIYTTVGAEQLVINGMNTLPLDTEIPLDVKTGSSTALSLKATEISNLSSGVNVVIKDKLYQTENVLTAGSAYNFTTEAASADSRFSLIFKTKGAVTTVPTTSTGLNARVYANGSKQITVQLNEQSFGTCLVAVYNSVGQKLVEKLMTSSTNAITGSLTPGVYVVTLNANGNRTTKKIVIN